MSANSEQKNSIHIRDANDAIGVIPYLIGFHPDNSVVVLMCEEGSIQGCFSIACQNLESRPQARDQLIYLVKQHREAHFLVLIYCPFDQEMTIVSLIHELIDDEHLIDCLTVDHDRYRSARLNRAQGRIVDIYFEGRDAPAVVEAIYAGLAAPDSRDEIIASLKSPRGGASYMSKKRLCRAELELVSKDIDEVEDLYRQILEDARSGKTVSDHDLARLAVMSAHPLWLNIILDSFEKSHAKSDHHLWRHVVAHTTKSEQSHPLGVLALLSWLDSQPVFGRICCELAEKIEKVSAIELFYQLDELGIDPHLWPHMKQAFTHECLTY